MKYLRLALILFIFCFSFGTSKADVLTGLSVHISSQGVIEGFTVACSGTDATALLLGDGYSTSHILGGYMRRPCINGSVTFDSFDLATELNQNGGAYPTWLTYFRNPFNIVVKNTTGLYAPSYTSLINLYGAFNNYNLAYMTPGDTNFPTLGAGSSFSFDGTTWTNDTLGDGSANYNPPSNVLFLPGIEASRLYRGARPDEGGGEKRLWEPTNDQDVRDLFLDDNGKEIAPLLPEYSVYTRDVLDEAYLTDLGPNIYKTFLAELEQMKSTDHVITDYSAVPYDWRLSLDDIVNNGTKTLQDISYIQPSITPYLISEISRLASSSPTGKVTIITHSNGGLVAKALLTKLATDNNPLLSKIEKIVFVAVPQVGTPSAILAMLHGYEQGILAWTPAPFLSEYVAREFAHNLPSAYNLLPSASYFSTISTPAVRFDSALSDWVSHYGEQVTDLAGLHNFLTDSFGRVATNSTNLSSPDQLSDSLLNQAEAVHNALDNWTAPSGVEVIEIAGWGVPSTVSSVGYKKTTCYRPSCGFLSKVISPKPEWTIDGDGTVVTPSALWMSGTGVSRYWVDISQYNKDHAFTVPLGVGHKDVLEINELNDFLKKIIERQSLSTLPQYIYDSAPVADPNDSRLIYTLRSPQSLDVFDSLGNHTGISTTTGKREQNIPGTTYINLGDSQYVFTTSSSTNNVVISNNSNNRNGPIFGGGDGTVLPFTLEISQLSGDTLVATTTFQDISSKDGGVSIITTYGNDITTTSPLVLSFSNNNIADYTLPSRLNAIVNMPVAEPVPDPVPAPRGSDNGPIMQTGATTTTTATTTTITPDTQEVIEKSEEKVLIIDPIPQKEIVSSLPINNKKITSKIVENKIVANNVPNKQADMSANVSSGVQEAPRLKNFLLSKLFIVLVSFVLVVAIIYGLVIV